MMPKFGAVLVVACAFAVGASAQFQETILSTDTKACSTPYLIDYNIVSNCKGSPCSDGAMYQCMDQVPFPLAGQFAMIMFAQGNKGCWGDVTGAVYHPLGVCGGATPNSYTYYKYNPGDDFVQQYSFCDTTCTICGFNARIPLGCSGGNVLYMVGSPKSTTGHEEVTTGDHWGTTEEHATTEQAGTTGGHTTGHSGHATTGDAWGTTGDDATTNGATTEDGHATTGQEGWGTTGQPEATTGDAWATTGDAEGTTRNRVPGAEQAEKQQPQPNKRPLRKKQQVQSKV